MLSEVARVAAYLVSFDPRLEQTVREIGVVMGSRMVPAPPPRALSLAVALARLEETCRKAEFVECEIIRHTGDEAHIRISGCARVLGGWVPPRGRAVCAFDAGLFAGFLRTLVRDEGLTVGETSCVTREGTPCEFHVRRRGAS